MKNQNVYKLTNNKDLSPRQRRKLAQFSRIAKICVGQGGPVVVVDEAGKFVS